MYKQILILKFSNRETNEGVRWIVLNCIRVSKKRVKRNRIYTKVFEIEQ